MNEHDIEQLSFRYDRLLHEMGRFDRTPDRINQTLQEFDREVERIKKSLFSPNYHDLFPNGGGLTDEELRNLPQTENDLLAPAEPQYDNESHMRSELELDDICPRCENLRGPEGECSCKEEE